jgi:YD repeat-containing protein
LISSFTRSNFSITTNLLASYNLQGQLIKTLDTSESYQSTTLYSYDGAGRIISIINSSLETDNQVRDSETHIWQYNDKGLPISMIKIKGETDSTFVMLKADENGNIIEEHPVRRGQPLPAVYYYYNSSKQLTDIVQYNEKAQRLLPIYIFEYDGSGNISSMVFVPSGSNDYQRWYYTYNDKGLRTKDACFDKKRQLMGSIEYNYSFGK